MYYEMSMYYLIVILTVCFPIGQINNNNNNKNYLPYKIRYVSSAIQTEVAGDMLGAIVYTFNNYTINQLLSPGTAHRQTN